MLLGLTEQRDRIKERGPRATDLRLGTTHTAPRVPHGVQKSRLHVGLGRWTSPGRYFRMPSMVNAVSG